MKYTIKHTNIPVFDLEKSIKFYEEALGMKVARRNEPEHGSFKIVYLEVENSSHQLELTWYRDKKDPWNKGDIYEDLHVCFMADDYEASYKKHKEMGIICYENTTMGIYFIADPDGYWMEITRDRTKTQ